MCEADVMSKCCVRLMCEADVLGSVNESRGDKMKSVVEFSHHSAIGCPQQDVAAMVFDDVP